MAGIVKKGYLDVKKKGMLGSTYKKQYVVLRRNTDEGTKVVEITSNEHLDNEIEFLPLTGVWSVQQKVSQNKKRYPFELFIGAHLVMTFSCPSVTERDAWIESFNVLNKISSYPTPLNAPDMFLVSLETNPSAAEIGVSGPCLLRIQDGAIVLYSECGRNKLYQWSAENVNNLSISEEQLFLEAKSGNDDSIMEFCFNTEKETGRQILTSWNLALMESIDPQKLSLISNYILSQGTSGNRSDERAQKSASLSKNFFGSLRHSKVYGGAKDDQGVIRRAKSFSEKATTEVRLSPDPKLSLAESRLSVASQESYTINAINPGSDEEFRNSPPPIPPRAPRRPRSLGTDTVDTAHPDPDYSYIKDDIPYGQSAQSVDKQLDDLLRDIEEDNYRKKRRQTLEPSMIRKTISQYNSESSSKWRTLGGMRYSDEFDRKRQAYFDLYGERQASDYLEPVPSKKVMEFEKRSSNPPLFNGSINEKEHDTLSKRHSTSGDFMSMRTLTSKHDYSTIPDTFPPPPQHFHSASTDSTQSAPDVPPRVRRPQNRDPPSPISHQIRSFPVRSSRGISTIKTDDISPYATATLSQPPPDFTQEDSPPPLPPRSPTKVHKVANQRYSRCNGIKKELTKTQSDHHHHHYRHQIAPSVRDSSLPDLCKRDSPLEETPFLSQTSQSTEGSSDVTSSIQSKRNSCLTDKTSTSSPPHEELESAIQMLDDCVKGLEVFENDLPESPVKLATATRPFDTNLDIALQQTQKVQNDLLLARKENTLPNSLQRSLSVSQVKYTPPATIFPASSTNSRRVLTIHHSTPSVDPSLSLPTTIAPAVSQRSFASLHSKSSTTTPSQKLDTKVTNHANSPIHKYLSQNNAINDQSNTVFAHHIKDKIRASHNI